MPLPDAQQARLNQLLAAHLPEFLAILSQGPDGPQASSPQRRMSTGSAASTPGSHANARGLSSSSSSGSGGGSSPSTSCGRDAERMAAAASASLLAGRCASQPLLMPRPLAVGAVGVGEAREVLPLSAAAAPGELRRSGDFQGVSQLMQRLRSAIGSKSPPKQQQQQHPQQQLLPQQQPAAVSPAVAPGPSTSGTASSTGQRRGPAARLLHIATGRFSPHEHAAGGGGASPKAGSGLHLRDFISCFSPTEASRPAASKQQWPPEAAASQQRAGSPREGLAGNSPDLAQAHTGQRDPHALCTGADSADAGGAAPPRSNSLPNMDSFWAEARAYSCPSSPTGGAESGSSRPPTIQQELLMMLQQSSMQTGRSAGVSIESPGGPSTEAAARAPMPGDAGAATRTWGSPPQPSSPLRMGKAKHSPSRLSTRSMPISHAVRDRGGAIDWVPPHTLPADRQLQGIASTPDLSKHASYATLVAAGGALATPQSRGSGASCSPGTGERDERGLGCCDDADSGLSAAEPQASPSTSPPSAAKRPLLARALFNRLRLHDDSSQQQHAVGSDTGGSPAGGMRAALLCLRAHADGNEQLGAEPAPMPALAQQQQQQLAATQLSSEERRQLQQLQREDGAVQALAADMARIAACMEEFLSARSQPSSPCSSSAAQAPCKAGGPVAQGRLLPAAAEPGVVDKVEAGLQGAGAAPAPQSGASPSAAAPALPLVAGACMQTAAPLLAAHTPASAAGGQAPAHAGAGANSAASPDAAAAHATLQRRLKQLGVSPLRVHRRAAQRQLFLDSGRAMGVLPRAERSPISACSGSPGRRRTRQRNASSADSLGSLPSTTCGSSLASGGRQSRLQGAGAPAPQWPAQVMFDRILAGNVLPRPHPLATAAEIKLLQPFVATGGPCLQGFAKGWGAVLNAGTTTCSNSWLAHPTTSSLRCMAGEHLRLLRPLELGARVGDGSAAEDWRLGAGWQLEAAAAGSEPRSGAAGVHRMLLQLPAAAAPMPDPEVRAIAAEHARAEPLLPQQWQQQSQRSRQTSNALDSIPGSFLLEPAAPGSQAGRPHEAQVGQCTQRLLVHAPGVQQHPVGAGSTGWRLNSLPRAQQQLGNMHSAAGNPAASLPLAAALPPSGAMAAREVAAWPDLQETGGSGAERFVGAAAAADVSFCSPQPPAAEHSQSSANTQPWEAAELQPSQQQPSCPPIKHRCTHVMAGCTLHPRSPRKAPVVSAARRNALRRLAMQRRSGSGAQQLVSEPAHQQLHEQEGLLGAGSGAVGLRLVELMEQLASRQLPARASPGLSSVAAAEMVLETLGAAAELRHWRRQQEQEQQQAAAAAHTDLREAASRTRQTADAACMTESAAPCAPAPAPLPAAAPARSAEPAAVSKQQCAHELAQLILGAFQATGGVIEPEPPGAVPPAVPLAAFAAATGGGTSPTPKQQHQHQQRSWQQQALQLAAPDAGGGGQRSVRQQFLSVSDLAAPAELLGLPQGTVMQRHQQLAAARARLTAAALQDTGGNGAAGSGSSSGNSSGICSFDACLRSTAGSPAPSSSQRRQQSTSRHDGCGQGGSHIASRSGSTRMQIGGHAVVQGAVAHAQLDVAADAAQVQQVCVMGVRGCKGWLALSQQ